MEPSLITKKALKKILKKNYFKQDNYFNKTFTNIIDTIKYNWLAIVIILSIIIILVIFYIEKQKRNQQEAEQFELEQEMDKINNKKNKYKEDFKNKPNYESEYYKMLPRVTNSPEVIDYMY